MTVLGMMGGVLSTMLACSSFYYHVCDVDYRIDVDESCIPKFQEQNLDKYKFSHIGWKPDLFPPKREAGWYETGPYIAKDGKTILQQFSSVPEELGGVRRSVREKCLSTKRTSAEVKLLLEAFPDVKPVSGSPKAVCILLAGLGDSVLRSAGLADTLACRGFAAHGFDYPGFGMSQQQAGLGSPCIPGYVKHWGKDICEEVVHFTKRVKKAYPPGTKCFVFAASIGGATALRSCIMEPQLFDGAVLLCPAILSDVKPFLQMIAPLIGLIFPRLFIGGLGDDDIGSRNLYGAWQIIHDPTKTNRPLLAVTGAAIIEHFNFLKANFHKMEVPFLAIHGMKDLIISPEGTKQLMEKASSVDRTVRWYEECWHDLLFEPEYQDVTDTAIRWMEGHSQSSMPLKPAEEAASSA
mmetsp:Transcript_16827/g.40339  ORF Transcript_16827/g.40339 Transcript_16827/m.40339 type:complete len:408 (-) Transcript_16827:266-1489(-)